MQGERTAEPQNPFKNLQANICMQKAWPAVRAHLQRAQQRGVEVEREEGVDDLDGVLLEDEPGVKVGGVGRDALGLHDQLAALGRQLEQLVLGRVHAAPLDVADLALAGARKTI